MKDWRIDVNKNSNGGTELLMDRLYNDLGEEYLKDFQIIPSRVRNLDKDKIRILWLHDLAGDPENNHLANNGWNKFHKLVFVSYIQREEYILRYGIPLSKTTVLHNSIEPIKVDLDKKIPTDKINIGYWTTPHRGLNILVPVFKKLSEEYSDIHLHVFSSFKIYGWPERDEVFQPLFNEIKSDPRMTYHETVPNDKIREFIKDVHIFAYPSIWQETSCLTLMEAMSAGCLCVHSSLGALPETASHFTLMYDYDENINNHANKFYAMLKHTINVIKENYPLTELKTQKHFTDLFYSWDLRKLQWKDLLDSTKNEYQGKNLSIPEQSFVYEVR